MSCCNEPCHILAAFSAGKAFPTPAGPFPRMLPWLHQHRGCFLRNWSRNHPCLPAPCNRHVGRWARTCRLPPVTQTPPNAPGRCTKTRRLRLFAHRQGVARWRKGRVSHRGYYFKPYKGSPWIVLGIASVTMSCCRNRKYLAGWLLSIMEEE